MKRFLHIVTVAAISISSWGALNVFPPAAEPAIAATCPVKNLLKTNANELVYGKSLAYNSLDLGQGPGVDENHVPRPEWSSNVDHKGVDIHGHFWEPVFAVTEGYVKKGGGRSSVGMGLYNILRKTDGKQGQIYARLRNNDPYDAFPNEISSQRGHHWPEGIDIGDIGGTGYNEATLGTGDTGALNQAHNQVNNNVRSADYLHFEVWTPNPITSNAYPLPNPARPIPYDLDNNGKVDFADVHPAELLYNCKNPTYVPNRGQASGAAAYQPTAEIPPPPDEQNYNPYQCSSGGQGYSDREGTHGNYYRDGAPGGNIDDSQQCREHVRYYLLKYASHYEPNNPKAKPGVGFWNQEDRRAMDNFMCRFERKNNPNDEYCRRVNSGNHEHNFAVHNGEWYPLHRMCNEMRKQGAKC